MPRTRTLVLLCAPQMRAELGNRRERDSKESYHGRASPRQPKSTSSGSVSFGALPAFRGNGAKAYRTAVTSTTTAATENIDEEASTTYTENVEFTNASSWLTSTPRAIHFNASQKPKIKRPLVVCVVRAQLRQPMSLPSGICKFMIFADVRVPRESEEFVAVSNQAAFSVFLKMAAVASSTDYLLSLDADGDFYDSLDVRKHAVAIIGRYLTKNIRRYGFARHRMASSANDSSKLWKHHRMLFGQATSIVNAFKRYHKVQVPLPLSLSFGVLQYDVKRDHSNESPRPSGLNCSTTTLQPFTTVCGTKSTFKSGGNGESMLCHY
ncbi:uncharacterized protein [Dermacentor albipictus]|uniref:uncharacterized protein isoform X2 n=1 Tax=Dermacentor albipictus TaxID=60249 RepID=UPI0038FC0197